MPARIRPLNGDEAAHIAGELARAWLFVDQFAPAEGDAPLSVGRLDLAVESWSAEGPHSAEATERVVATAAAALGQILVERLSMAWTMADDDLAVHGLPGNGDVLVFVADIAGKRIASGPVDFLQQSYRRVARHIDALRKTRS